MKRCLERQKTKIIVVSAILILLLSCFTTIMNHDIVFANPTFNVMALNTLSIDEIASQEKYNSCDYNIVTPNLDQGSTNICWAYATASASETSVLKDKLDNNTKDTLRFSPKQIA